MNNKKLCASLILLTFVMVGESIPLSNIMEFDELAKVLIEGGGSGRDTVDEEGNRLSGFVCKKSCRALGEECGFSKGFCCSDSNCYGTCKKTCKAKGEECGIFKGICCSDLNCIDGACKQTCIDEGQACGFTVGVCCSGTSCTT